MPAEEVGCGEVEVEEMQDCFEDGVQLEGGEGVAQVGGVDGVGACWEGAEDMWVCEEVCLDFLVGLRCGGDGCAGRGARHGTDFRDVAILGRFPGLDRLWILGCCS